MKKTISVTLTLVMSATILLSGCSKKQVEVPELVEPVAVTEVYVEVARGNIGVPDIELAEIAAKEHCQTFSQNAEIREIVVEYGDYVKKGDILAYANIQYASEEEKALREELAYEEKLYKFNDEILLQKIKKAGLEKASKSEIDTLREERKYRTILFERKKKSINKRIEEKTDMVNSGTLLANHDGYVTYKKDLLTDSRVSSTEAVVIITDKDDKYLEMSETTVEKSTKLFEAQSRYIINDGKRVELSELKYSPEELGIAKFSDKSPLVRFTFDGIDELAIGDTCYVYYEDETVENTICVDNDAVFSDSETSNYVYVLENGNKVRRDVEIGARDKYKTEILSGLKEGERVYHKYGTLIPTETDLYKVENCKVDIANGSRDYSIVDTDIVFETAQTSGYVIEVGEKFKKNESVSKGDYLYSLSVDAGKAAIYSAKVAYERAQKNYSDTLKKYDKNISQLESGKKSSVNDCDIAILKAERAIAELELKRNADALKEDYQKKMKDNNNGIVKVYAQNSGKIGIVNLDVGVNVYEGNITHTVIEEGDKLIKVVMSIPRDESYNCDTNNIADIDEKVTLNIGDTNYTGTCVGYQYDGDRVYTDMVDGKAQSANVICPDDGLKAFYVKMDNEDAYKGTVGNIINFSQQTINQGIIIPYNSVKSTIINGESKPYVWKKSGNDIVRQFVDIIDVKTGVLVLYGLQEGDEIVK